MQRRLRESTWSLDQTRDEFERLAGIMGGFRSVEITELIATPNGGTARNVLAVAVAEERDIPVPDRDAPLFLNGDERLRVDGYDGWSFGLRRTHHTIAAFLAMLDQFGSAGTWSPTGHPRELGNMVARPPSFAPSDGTDLVPLNRVLKNNFWSGSHVFHIADGDKTAWQVLLDHPSRLQQLSSDIRRFVPWKIAALSDLLGDIVIQLPASAIVTTQEIADDGEEYRVDIAWRPEVEPRPVQIGVDLREDGLILGSRLSPATSDQATLAFRARRGKHVLVVWDAASGDVLAATAPTTYWNRYELGMAMTPHEPRTFTTPSSPTPIRIELRGRHRRSTGGIDADPYDRWLASRRDAQEADKLRESLEFVQYGSTSDAAGERERAVDDIRSLIARHGEHEVWLWDPYLSAADVLDTLFYCPWSGAELRALTSGKARTANATRQPSGRIERLWRCLWGEPRAPSNSKEAYRDEQQVILDRHANNRAGLNLEFRMRIGMPGWDFHDRFLIFPRSGAGPRAWSLGTSVNTVGESHHILQLASNSALIKSAFEDLWNRLDQPEHVVWRHPS